VAEKPGKDSGKTVEKSLKASGKAREKIEERSRRVVLTSYFCLSTSAMGHPHSLSSWYVMNRLINYIFLVLYVLKHVSITTHHTVQYFHPVRTCSAACKNLEKLL
jgi:hypothetical protein